LDAESGNQMGGNTDLSEHAIVMGFITTTQTEVVELTVLSNGGVVSIGETTPTPLLPWIVIEEIQ